MQRVRPRQANASELERTPSAAIAAIVIIATIGRSPGGSAAPRTSGRGAWLCQASDSLHAVAVDLETAAGRGDDAGHAACLGGAAKGAESQRASVAEQPELRPLVGVPRTLRSPADRDRAAPVHADRVRRVHALAVDVGAVLAALRHLAAQVVARREEGGEVPPRRLRRLRLRVAPAAADEAAAVPVPHLRARAPSRKAMR